MNSEYFLELREATRSFTVGAGLFQRRKKLRAVNGVTLGVRKGEVLGIVGESGCGKSTIARMLLGLLEPSSGEIYFDGQPLYSMERLARARRILPVFQDPYSSLNPRKTIAEIISLPLRVHKIGTDAEHQGWLTAIMERVGLSPEYLPHYPNQLSGGQRQRVAIARALIMRPEIVICDEPTSALDVSVQSQILNLLMDLRREFGLTYILISHNLAVVEHIATRVAVMYLGRIVEEADTETLFSDPKHPYTRALLDSVLTPEPELGVPDAQLGIAFPNPLEPPSGCTFHPRCIHAMPICRQRAPVPLDRDGGGYVECHLYDEAHAPAPPRQAHASPDLNPPSSATR